MSLVGPRPIVRAEVARYGREIEHYYGREARPHGTAAGQRTPRHVLRTPRAA
jgi:lipopolysaccharide/colanic/teichoic acid biosynthesis glycosyltransferase